jgi:hypothetical protein
LLLTQKKSRLEADARKLAPGAKLNLTEGEQKLEQLKKDREELKRFVAGLQKIIKEENDPERKKLLALVEEAKLLEREFEFEKAIQRYQKARTGGLDDPALDKHLQQLQADWKVASDDHQKARAFVYQVWPGLDPATMRKKDLDEAHQAFETCAAVGDPLTPQKLLYVTNEHVRKLKERLDALQADVNEDRKKKAEALLEVIEGINKLREEVTEYVKKTAGK